MNDHLGSVSPDPLDLKLWRAAKPPHAIVRDHVDEAFTFLLTPGFQPRHHARLLGMSMAAIAPIRARAEPHRARLAARIEANRISIDLEDMLIIGQRSGHGYYPMLAILEMTKQGLTTAEMAARFGIPARAAKYWRSVNNWDPLTGVVVAPRPTVVSRRGMPPGYRPQDRRAAVSPEASRD